MAEDSLVSWILLCIVSYILMIGFIGRDIK